MPMLVRVVIKGTIEGERGGVIVYVCIVATHPCWSGDVVKEGENPESKGRGNLYMHTENHRIL